jgi:hypothetical protein
MELPAQGLYCVAKNNGDKTATLMLPYPINQSTEIAIKYLAVTPAWNHHHDLGLFVTDDKEEAQRTVAFNDITENMNEHQLVSQIKEQLVRVFGANGDLRISGSYDTYVFKLKKSRIVTFTPTLAELLGVNHYTFENKADTEKVIHMNIQRVVQPITNDMYYLRCDQAVTNFVSDGMLDRTLEWFHIAGRSTFEFYPALKYTKIDVSLLHRLSFSLYKESGIVDSLTNTTDLYIICHIRPCN